MKINITVKKWLICATMMLGLSATIAEAGIRLKMVGSDSYQRNGDTITVTRFAPTFSHSGTLSLPLPGCTDTRNPMGEVEIFGEVHWLESSAMPGAGDVSYTLHYEESRSTNIIDVAIKISKEAEKNGVWESAPIYNMLCAWEFSRKFDILSNKNIALLSLEPFIKLNQSHPAWKELQDAHTALVETLEARAGLNAVLSAAGLATRRDYLESGATDFSHYQPDYRYLFEDGLRTAITFFDDTRGTAEASDYRISKSCSELFEDSYPDLRRLGAHILEYMCQNGGESGPSKFLSTADWKIWVRSISDKEQQGKTLTDSEKTVLQFVSRQEALLKEAVAAYEHAVRAAIAEMSKLEQTKDRQKREPEPIQQEEKKTSSPDTGDDDTPTPPGGDTPTVSKPSDGGSSIIDGPFGGASSDKNVSLPQLLPDTNDLRQLILDARVYEPKKLGEILLFIQDRERAEMVSAGENALLKRWLRQYENKVVKISKLNDLPQNDGVAEEMLIKLADRKYYEEMKCIRNEYLVPGYNNIADADFYHCDELRDILTLISNRTKIIVDKKRERLNTGEDVLRNFLQTVF